MRKKKAEHLINSGQAGKRFLKQRNLVFAADGFVFVLGLQPVANTNTSEYVVYGRDPEDGISTGICQAYVLDNRFSWSQHETTIQFQQLVKDGPLVWAPLVPMDQIAAAAKLSEAKSSLAQLLVVSKDSCQYTVEIAVMPDPLIPNKFEYLLAAWDVFWDNGYSDRKVMAFWQRGNGVWERRTGELKPVSIPGDTSTRWSLESL